MSDTRHANVDWNLGQTKDGVSWNMVQAALLMDIRDELRCLNAALRCPNLTGIRYELQHIRRNTNRRKKTNKQRKAP